MCIICSLTQTFDPNRHLDLTETGLDGSGLAGATQPGTGVALATQTESADAVDSIATIYSIQVGDIFVGGLETGEDSDWVAVTLEAGQTYQISLTGQSSGGTLVDPLLRLYDANGVLIGFNDDIVLGVNLDSELTFTPNTSGTYFVAAGSYNNSYTGTYEMSLITAPSVQEATLDEMAAYLTDGYWQDQGFTGFRFDTSLSNEITVNISALTPVGQQLARWAFEAWEMVADIVFVEISGSAQITFDDTESGAFAGPDDVVDGFITTSSVNIGTEWLAIYGSELDSYSFSTYLHEIGHALGLGHQGNYNGNAVYGIDETFVNDSTQLSVMSYFSQIANPTVGASYAELLTPMMVDVIAIQNLYGVPDTSSGTAGDTIWGGTGSTLGNYLDVVFDYFAGNGGNGDIAGNPMAFTIYDQGGIDTVDLSWSTTNDRIDLRQESFSNIGGLIGNVAIARGTIIERAGAGNGNDTVFGNVAANAIAGRQGNDVLHGYAASDTLHGDAGNDTLYGGTHFDELHGGTGNDLVVGGNGRDTFFGENGDDVLQDNGQRGTLARDLFFGGNGNDTVYAGGANDTLRGDAGDDVLYGGLDNDVIYGGSNYDMIFGNAHDDTLYGDNGRDTVNGGNGNDLLIDNAQTGVHGADLMIGEAGDDTIRLGGGDDTAVGGAGSDTFAFAPGHGADVITDFDALDGNEEIDLSAIATITDITGLLAAATQVGADVQIDTGGGNSILLENVDQGNLDADDFIFV